MLGRAMAVANVFVLVVVVFVVLNAKHWTREEAKFDRGKLRSCRQAMFGITRKARSLIASGEI